MKREDETVLRLNPPKIFLKRGNTHTLFQEEKTQRIMLREQEQEFGTCASKYVMSGEKKKECISRVIEKVCTFQPSDSDKETLWGNADLSACLLPNCIFHC